MSAYTPFLLDRACRALLEDVEEAAKTVVRGSDAHVADLLLRDLGESLRLGLDKIRTGLRGEGRRTKAKARIPLRPASSPSTSSELEEKGMASELLTSPKQSGS